MKVLLLSLAVIAVSLVGAISTPVDNMFFMSGAHAAPVPEPETLSLLAIGALALVISKFRKRK